MDQLIITDKTHTYQINTNYRPNNTPFCVEIVGDADAAAFNAKTLQ